MAEVTKSREFVVAVPNRVGSLAKLLDVLAEGKINMIALSGEGKGRQGIIRFVTTDAAKTTRVLKKAGIKAKRDDVLVVTLPDKPGKGAALAEALAKAGVNIRSAYGAAAGSKALVVLNVNKTAAASRAIQKL
jgi:hypothetical protein